MTSVETLKSVGTEESQESSVQGKKASGNETKIEKHAETASLLELFSMAEPFDYLLMFLGVVGACGNGIAIPIFNVLFGRFLDTLNNVNSSFSNAVAELSLTFVYIGIAVTFAASMQIVCWIIAGERQVNRFRAKYVQSILSQEIGWFDACGASTLSTKVAELTGKIEDGLGRKTGDMIQYIAQTVAAFVIAFYYSWKLTLVLISALPVIAISGAFMIKAITSAQVITS